VAPSRDPAFKADVPTVFRDAWAKGRRTRDLVIVGAHLTSQTVGFTYVMEFEGHSAVTIDAIASLSLRVPACSSALPTALARLHRACAAAHADAGGMSEAFFNRLPRDFYFLLSANVVCPSDSL
jgi:hypothetical protein